MVAQIWQAIGSFGLQLTAAWLLGAAGLGLFSLCLGIVVLASALTSGMVGDSLVVLDRRDRAIRGGLQAWTLILSAAFFLVTVITLPVSGLLTPVEAVVLGLALVAFQAEELVRRALMANLRFWHLVVMDTVAALVGLGFVAGWVALAPAGLTTFFLALLVGQLAGLAVGIALLPRAERSLVSLRGAAVRRIVAFGGWRGAQVSVGPLVLTAMRITVTAIAGGFALGELELARVYVAPVLLAVQGLGSYLLSSYVSDREQELGALVRRAWRASGSMMLGAITIGGALVLIGPYLTRFVSGPDVDLNRLALLGWVMYAVATASVQPFASLAAARGRPDLVFRCRLADATVAVVGVVLLLQSGVAVSWVPMILAAGLVLGGFLVRRIALRPLLIAVPRRGAARGALHR